MENPTPRTNVYVGIDVGKKGGIVFMDEDLKPIQKHIMPMLGKEYDIQELKNILSNPYVNILHLAIENVHAIQGRTGNSSNFSFGLGKGILMGMVAGLEIPYTLVNPKTWQKVAWEGVTKQADTKKTSLVAAKRLFPTEDFLATERSRVPHDGLVDGALMAYYIALKFNA
jgi:crossover junction endodeoxyribonuclease RuvC